MPLILPSDYKIVEDDDYIITENDLIYTSKVKGWVFAMSSRGMSLRGAKQTWDKFSVATKRKPKEISIEQIRYEEITDENYFIVDGDGYKLNPTCNMTLFNQIPLNHNLYNLKYYRKNNSNNNIILYKRIVKPRFECKHPYPFGY